MSIEGLLISLVLVVATVAWVLWPFLQRQPAGYTSDDIILHKQRERLLVYYERVLTNLRDLDEDHITGKIHDDEYRVEREEWVQRGIQVLKAIDELDHHHLIVPDADQETLDHAIDDAIEQAIAVHRRAAH